MYLVQYVFIAAANCLIYTLLNPDKSVALVVGTTDQLRAVTSSVSVTGADLLVAEEIKVLGVVFDRRLTFHKHVSAWHDRAIIRHLLTTELEKTLASSLILSRIDYCNAVLHGAPSYMQHQEVTACAELGSSHRSPGTKTIPRQHVVEDVTLAARSAVDQVQSGSADVQSLQHVHAGVASSPNPVSTTWPYPAIGHHDTVSTVQRRHLQSAPSDAQLRLSGIHHENCSQ